MIVLNKDHSLPFQWLARAMNHYNGITLNPYKSRINLPFIYISILMTVPWYLGYF